MKPMKVRATASGRAVVIHSRKVKVSPNAVEVSEVAIGIAESEKTVLATSTPRQKAIPRGKAIPDSVQEQKPRRRALPPQKEQTRRAIAPPQEPKAKMVGRFGSEAVRKLMVTAQEREQHRARYVSPEDWDFAPPTNRRALPSSSRKALPNPEDEVLPKE